MYKFYILVLRTFNLFNKKTTTKQKYATNFIKTSHEKTESHHDIENK